MRIDRSAIALLFTLTSTFALSTLTGCPGTLADRQRFLDAINAGGSAGSAGQGNGGKAGEDTTANETAGEAGADSGPCGDVVARIFEPSCGGTGCHGSVAAQQDLDLVSPGVASRVVGVTGTGCSVTLADPADPEASLIYQKLSPTPPCGSPMPLARPALSDQDAACVLAWIAAQAP